MADQNKPKGFDDVLIPIYSNTVNVSVNQNELVFEFLFTDPKSPNAAPIALKRIVMPPGALQGIRNLLDDHIQKQKGRQNQPPTNS